jgi:hypothetical protein
MILLCEWGELAHAAKHPRDRPRTRPTLSERLCTMSLAEPVHSSCCVCAAPRRPRWALAHARRRRARESHGWFLTTAAQPRYSAPRWSSPSLPRRRSSPVVSRLLFGRRSVRSEGAARGAATDDAHATRAARVNRVGG